MQPITTLFSICLVNGGLTHHNRVDQSNLGLVVHSISTFFANHFRTAAFHDTLSDGFFPNAHKTAHGAFPCPLTIIFPDECQQKGLHDSG